MITHRNRAGVSQAKARRPGVGRPGSQPIGWRATRLARGLVHGPAQSLALAAASSPAAAREIAGASATTVTSRQPFSR